MSTDMNKVKVGKLPIVASYTFNLCESGKNMVAFCSTVQKSHWLFCVGSCDC